MYKLFIVLVVFDFNCMLQQLLLVSDNVVQFVPFMWKDIQFCIGYKCKLMVITNIKWLLQDQCLNQHLAVNCLRELIGMFYYLLQQYFLGDVRNPTHLEMSTTLLVVDYQGLIFDGDRREQGSSSSTCSSRVFLAKVAGLLFMMEPSTFTLVMWCNW